MMWLKSFLIAFSIYSRIPVPQFPWKDEDLRYTLCFFPLVGIVIGLCERLWLHLTICFHVGDLAFSLIAVAIPLLLTGGFHVDGFMDTTDALRSYQEKDRRLEILKDPHIGAFAVIGLVSCLLLATAAVSELLLAVAAVSELPILEKPQGEVIRAASAIFWLSRILSGLTVLYFPVAKKDGSLSYFRNTADRRLVTAVLVLQGILCNAYLLFATRIFGAIVVSTAVASLLVYRYYLCPKFGGITGDTAGWFVTVSEVAAVVVLAAMSRFIL